MVAQFAWALFDSVIFDGDPFVGAPSSGTLTVPLVVDTAEFAGLGPWTISNSMTVANFIETGAAVDVTGKLTITNSFQYGSALDQATPHVSPTIEPGGTITLAPGATGASIALDAVNFAAGASETLAIGSQTVTVGILNGFSPGDTIDFVNQPNLTFSIDTTTPNEVDVFSPAGASAKKIYTLQFSAGTNLPLIEPLSDEHGGTKIVFDPTPVVLDPQIAGSTVEWDFIHLNEGIGGQPEPSPYVPASALPDGKSGATIGLGVDLGKVNTVITDADLALLGSATNPNLAVIKAILDDGSSGQDAVDFLNSKGHVSSTNTQVGDIGPQLDTVSLDLPQLAALDNIAETRILTDVESNWANGIAGVTPGSTIAFSALPKQAQTALVDVAFNFGADAFPKTFKDFIAAGNSVTDANKNGDPTLWAKVADDLSHFLAKGAATERLLRDAALIESIPNVLGPPAPVQTTVINGKLDFTSVSSAEYAITTTGGDVYTLTNDAGSPNLASIRMPSDPLYAVSFVVNGQLTQEQSAAPDATIDAPANATGVQVRLLDDNGNQLTTPSDFVFFVKYVSDGSVNATVSETPFSGPSDHGFVHDLLKIVGQAVHDLSKAGDFSKSGLNFLHDPAIRADIKQIGLDLQHEKSLGEDEKSLFADIVKNVSITFPTPVNTLDAQAMRHISDAIAGAGQALAIASAEDSLPKAFLNSIRILHA